jgi:hypothetical protein
VCERVNETRELERERSRVRVRERKYSIDTRVQRTRVVCIESKDSSQNKGRR